MVIYAKIPVEVDSLVEGRTDVANNAGLGECKTPPQTYLCSGDDTQLLAEIPEAHQRETACECPIFPDRS